MTLWKPGVVLLALLLAAMAMVPMVSADEGSPALQAGDTSAVSGQESTVGSRLMGSDYSIKNVDMSERISTRQMLS
jgi:hypothetical protein